MIDNYKHTNKHPAKQQPANKNTQAFYERAYKYAAYHNKRSKTQQPNKHPEQTDA